MLRGCLTLLTIVLCALPALAEDKPAAKGKTPSVPQGDFLAALRAVDDGVAPFRSAPADPGLYDKHQKTWKRYAKPRIRRMRGRIKLLVKPKLWGLDKDATGPALSLAEGSWSALVKGVTSLYVGLGTMRARYGEQRVNNSYARKLWLHYHPGPEPIERVAGRDALDDIAATIRDYRYEGLAVPYRLLSAHGRLADLVARQEAAARAVKRAEYNAAKHAAYAAIDASVASTMGALRADVDQFRAQQVALQRIVAAAQEIEELRLKALVAKAPTEGDALAKVPAMFRAMEAGRRAGRDFNDARSSRWGSLVRQKWMTQRTKILSALKKAKRDATKAAALKNEEPPK